VTKKKLTKMIVRVRSCKAHILLRLANLCCSIATTGFDLANRHPEPCIAGKNTKGWEMEVQR